VQLTAVRQRSCPGCQRPVRERSARWCGACGTPLRPTADEDVREAGPDLSPRPGLRRRLLATGTASVVVVALVLAGGPVIDRLPDGSAADDLEVATPSAGVLERVSRRFRPPPPPLRDPVCLREAGVDCFRWTVADRDLAGAQLTVAGDLLLATDLGGTEMTARRLTDGGVAWRASLGEVGGPGRVLTTDALLLTVDDDGLTARDLAGGDVRWRTDELPRDVTFLAARQRAEELVLVAVLDAPVLDDGTVVGPAATILGLDAATGRTTWKLDTAGPAGIGRDATTAYIDEEGQLVALEPDGSVRWEVAAVTPGSAGGTWVNGGFVTVWSNDDEAGDRLHRLSDGRPLGTGGTVLASDGDRTLLEVWRGRDGAEPPPDPDGGSPLDGVGDGPAYVLIDGDATERWRVAAEPPGCTLGAQLEGEQVRIIGCGGAELVLAASDGSVRSRTPAIEVTDGEMVAFAERVGPYALQPEAPSRATSAWNLVDTRTAVEVARLPPDSLVVTREGDPAWTNDLGGFAVIHHRGGLVALDLPSVRAAGSGRTVPPPHRRIRR
jgi:hypothetical protein